MLQILILGAAAGGGFPQWNCNCPGCRSVRAGEAVGSTQLSLALSADGENWVLVNAAPEILSQIAENPELHPGANPGVHPDGALRQSPIKAVVLTNGEIDAVAGLLSLREGTAFELWASQSVLNTLAENSIFNVLRPGVVQRRPVGFDQTFSPSLPDGRALGLRITPFSVPGKPAWYLEEHALADEGDTIALEICAGTQRAYIFTACAEVTEPIRERIRGADLVLFDGTLWRDDEMIRAGLAQKTGAAMGHISISGPQGAIARLADLDIRRKVFIHINNSNPILRPGTAERHSTESAGWEIGQKGARYALCSN